MPATTAAARRRSHRFDAMFQVAALAALVLALAALATLLVDVFIDGWPRLNWQFLTSGISRRPEDAGIVHALAGSLWVMALTGALALPTGVGAAIYLEEYSGRGRVARLVELNIANLAAVPSIVFGLLGLAVFVRYMAMGRSVLAGAATLTLLVLPIVILSTREAIRAVPVSIREASYALGATKWQTVWHQVLPMALPGILTGVILALSRAMGETAPLVAIGALTYIPFAPDSVWSPFTVLPIQIFNWASRPQDAFAANAAAGILVLLGLLLTVNAIAIVIRDRSRRERA
ncbi:MAG: phosphate ABC transporter permease PstA [Vicinamibacterales bacterium]